MIVKITILRLLGSSDDKEKIAIARPDGYGVCGLYICHPTAHLRLLETKEVYKSQRSSPTT